jgi:hypothetical protein
MFTCGASTDGRACFSCRNSGSSSAAKSIATAHTVPTLPTPTTFIATSASS